MMSFKSNEKDEDLIQELKEEVDIQADLKDLLMNKTDYASFYGPVSLTPDRTS